MLPSAAANERLAPRRPATFRRIFAALRQFIEIAAKVAAVLVVLTVGMVSLVVETDVCLDWQFVGSRPLINGLPDDPREASREFQRRLTAAFPAGRTGGDLIEYLARQGFVLTPRSEGLHEAQLTRVGGLHYLKERNWRVVWREDARGNIVDLHASFEVALLETSSWA